MKKQILFGSEARQKLRKGINATADAVKLTMGARGRIVNLSYGSSTKDGVTVARDVELEDNFENKGVQLLQAASIKTNDVVGDGTTATCVLAQAIINKGFDLIDNGKDAQQLRRELEDTKESVISLLAKESKKIQAVEQVATISANDERIGKLVAQAVDKVGYDGLVVVENSYKSEDEVEIASGMQIDKGIKYPVFYTDPTRRKAEYKDALVILHDGDIHDVQGFFTMLGPAFAEGKAVIVFANAFDTQVLHNMFLLRMQKGVKILPIISPHVYREESLEDIAVYTGARVLKESDSFIEQNVYDICGVVSSVISTPECTTLRSTGDYDAEIAKRIKQIESLSKTFKDAEKREVLKRAARLRGQIAIIRAYSTTDEEAKEKHDRFDDAIFASQAALKDGVVTGGGMTFLRVADKVKGDTDGKRLIKEALETPMRQIALNAGRNPSDIVNAARVGDGYNAKTDSFGDLDRMGILDPVAALQTAFENALSVSIIALTTEALIAKVEDKKDE